MRIIGVDPGGTTGLCRMDTEAHPMWIHKQLSGEHYSGLYDWLTMHFSKGTVIICEGWQNRGRHAPKQIGPEYIGVVKLAYQQLGEAYGLTYVHQWPEQKEWWTTEKLMRIGLYQPGMPHAMDALRHILYYVTFKLEDQTWIRALRG